MHRRPARRRKRGAQEDAGQAGLGQGREGRVEAISSGGNFRPGTGAAHPETSSFASERQNRQAEVEPRDALQRWTPHDVQSSDRCASGRALAEDRLRAGAAELESRLRTHFAAGATALLAHGPVGRQAPSGVPGLRHLVLTSDFYLDASTSARCRVSILCPARCNPPPICIRHPQSLETTTSAPLSRMRTILSSSIAPEMCGNLTENNPPKPQHSSRSRRSHDADSVHRAKQRARLFAHAQFAHQMARRMIGDGVLEARADVFHLQHIDQELRELEHPRAHRVGLGEQLGLVGEQVAIKNLDHAGARARRDHDRRARLACFEEAARECLASVAKAFVEGAPARSRTRRGIGRTLSSQPLEHARPRRRAPREKIPPRGRSETALLHSFCIYSSGQIIAP